MYGHHQIMYETMLQKDILQTRIAKHEIVFIAFVSISAEMLQKETREQNNRFRLTKVEILRYDGS